MSDPSLLHDLLGLQVSLDMRDDRQALFRRTLQAFLDHTGARSGALLACPDPALAPALLHTVPEASGPGGRAEDFLAGLPDPPLTFPGPLPGQPGDWLFPLPQGFLLRLRQCPVLSDGELLDLGPALDFLGTLLGRMERCARLTDRYAASARLNQVLTAAHRITLLATEPEAGEEVLQRACSILVECGVSRDAVVLLYDPEGRVRRAYHDGPEGPCPEGTGSGAGRTEAPVWQSHGLPACVAGGGSVERVRRVRRETALCEGCPLAGTHPDGQVLVLALGNGNGPRGHILLGDLPSPLDSGPRIELLQTLADELSVVLQHQRSREVQRSQASLLERRQQAQELLIRCSQTLLLGESGSEDQRITAVLEELARFAGAERAYIFQPDPGGDTLSSSHEWCDTGFPRQRERLQGMPATLFPWWNDRMGRNEQLWIRTPADLAEEAVAERNLLRVQGIRSLLALPLDPENRSPGFVSFDWLSRETTLEDELLSVMQLGVNLIRGVLARQTVLRQLSDSRERMDLALRGADLGTWSWFPVTGRLEVDERWCAMLGLETGAVEPHIGFLLERLHPADRARVDETIQAVLAGQSPSFEIRHRIRAADGRWLWILAKGRVIQRDGEGRALRLSGTHLDVSAQERASRIWRSAFHHSSQLMALSTFPDRRFLEVNRAFLDALGLSREDVLGRTPRELGLEGVIEQDREMEQVLGREGVIRNHRVSLKSRDGRVIHGLFSVERVDLEDDQPCLLSSLTDITGMHEEGQRRQQAEARLFQVQKMESIGLLAGGVAHDFNNLLSIIMGNSEMLLEEVRGDTRVEAKLGSILEAGERAQSLTRQLLMFSRQQVISPRPLDPNRLIENALKMYRRLIGEDIRLEFDPGGETGEVLADPQQLEQVLANLLINGRDAIHGAGPERREAVIRISTRLVHLDEGTTRFGSHPAGSYLRLAVADTGSGMEPAVIERIFDPFFTTKPAGRGTGLGLATVLGVVSQNGGVIEVESEPGRGSVFVIHWPALARTVPLEQAAPARATLPGGSENLLLVEDEPTLLELVRKQLARRGYEVHAVPTAEAAPAVVEDGGWRPDLLVTDLVLPGRNGRELAEQLRRTLPGLKVLYTSGYTQDILERFPLDPETDLLLHKPFTMEVLLEQVRRLLDSR